MKRHILTVSILLVAAQLFGQESRFWVGGSGSWTDESHWSTTSGGEPGATVPESGTSVVFDENSFSGARNTVSFSDAVQVGSFTAIDANFALSGKKDFTVSGSISVDANADFGKLRGALVLSGEGNNTINIFPIVPTDVIIDGGSWTLAIPLDVDGNITLKSGSLNANGHSIACAEFSATEKAEMLNIKKSTIVCDKWNLRSASNLTLEAENSKILFRDTPQGNFFTIDGLKYGVIGTYRASKASLTPIPTAVSCPENAQTVLNDGSIRVIIDGEGEFKVLLSEVVLNDEGNGTIKSISKVGKDVTFPNVAPGTHMVSYQVGTSISEPQNVTVGYAPIFSGGIIVGTGATCWGDDLILTHNITGGTGEYSFTWENNGGGYGSSATFTAIAGRTNFLTIEDENHCVYVAEKYAYRPTGPANMNNYTDGPERITATFDNEASCVGEETGIIHINASGGTGALSFSYAGPGSHSGTTDSPDISGLPAGEYDILISDEAGCDNTTNATKLKSPNDLSTEITPIPAPVANAGADVTICKEKLSYTVNDASAENDESINWLVSGPASITSGGDTKSPTISLDGVGKATLSMIVTNGTCTPDTCTKTIDIIATPEPTMDDSDRSVCGLSTSIAATAKMGGDLEVDFVSTTSGGSVSSIDGLNVTVTKAGAYTFRVKETEKSAAKCPGFSTGTVTITFYDEPTLSLTSTSGSTCGTTPVDIKGSSTNCTLQWAKSSNAAGTFSSETTVNTTYTPAASDAGKTITLTLTGTSEACPVVYAYYTLTVKKVPNPSAPTIAADVCGLTTLASATHSLSGSTLTWKPIGGGLTFGSPNGETTTVTATSANTYNIYVEETLDGCPKESAATPVTFYDAPTVTITTGTSGTVCGNKTISLSATSNCTNVKWSGGAGTFSPDNSLNTVYTPGEADYGKTITLTLTATSNHPTVCTAPETATFELTVGDVPAPTIDALGDICGLTTTATAHATLGGTLTWDNGGDNTLKINPPTGANVTIDGDNGVYYNVTVTEATTEGCSATSSPQSVTFHKAPEVTVPSPDDICETGDVEVAATATDATDLVWTATGAGTLTQSGSSSSKTAKFVPSAADQDVTLTVTASNGGICPAVPKTYTFHVYANPTPSIASAIEICGTTDVITANMTTAGNKVVWNASAGVTLTGQSETGTTATITATLNEGAAYGTYAITMTEINGANCSATATANVTFKAKPVMEFEEYEATICAGDDYTVNVITHENFTNYQWIVSDGGTPTLGSNAATYHAALSTEWKQVTISATPKYGCDESGGKKMTLTVNPMPVPNIENATVCGLEYTLPTTTQSVTGTTSDFAWSTASPGASVTATQFKANAEGTYTLRLTEMVGSCQAYDEADITFVAEPVIFEAINDAVCADQATYPLSAATADHYTSLLWTSSGNGTFDNASTLKPTYTFGTDEIAAGSVTLTLTLTPNAPCVDPLSSSVTITINPLPVPTIMADDEICQDKTGTYTTESGMSNYYWSVDGGTPESGTETFDYTWTTAGPHKVSVSYTNGNGCTAAVATDFDLTVHDLPTSALSSTETSCTNGSVGLDATASGGSGSFSYAWSGDGVDYLDDDKSATPTFACTTAGTYNLTCTISDNTYGCSKDYKIVITNTQGPSAFAGKDTTICYGSDYVLLDASFENGTTIEWSSESGGTFGDINDLHTTYKPSDADLAAHKAILTLTVDSESCGKTTDKVTINILPEFVVAVGGIIPFPIASSTKIEVQVVGSIVEAYDLGYYLVAPDGTSLKLYDHKSDKGMEDLPGLWPAAGDEFDFIFTTSPALELDLAQFTMNQPQSGTFGITGDVSGIYGKNPAEGGWAVRVGGPYSTGGKLQQAVIKFTDYNYDGDLQTITFNSRVLNPVEIIPDHHTLSYISPIGLNVTCYGGNDARAVANAIGGSGVYNIFEWAKDEDFNDLVSDNDTTDLYAGTYYVRVTDSHGCKATTTVEVGQPEKIKIEKLSQDTVKCYGGNDGSILVTSSDGVGEPTYRWIDVLTSNEKSTVALASELTAGSYKVTVTDENGCTSDSIFVMPEPDSISISAVVTLTPCGTTDGEVQFTVSGGTQGKVPASKYTITCNDAGAVIDNDALKVTNLMGGSITFTITDAKGCSKDTTINTIPDPMTLSFVADSIDCYNGTTSVAVVVGNGDPDFSFMWNGDNTLTDSILTGIPAGRYYVDVIDENGCPASDTITIGQPSQIKDTIIFAQAIQCYGDNVASFYAEAKGGTAANKSYNYTWFNFTENTEVADSVLSNVGAGKYAVMITDDNNCPIYDTITIQQPEKPLAVLSADTVKSECAVPTGKIKLNLEGGVQPYSFSWFVVNTTDIIGTVDSIKDIAADIYVAKIVDSLGCAIYDTVEVLDKGNIEFGKPVTNDVACIQHPTGEATINTVYGLDADGNINNVFTKSMIIWNGTDTVAQGETVKTLHYGSNRVVVVADDGCRRAGSVDIGNTLALRVTNIANYPDLTGDPNCDGSLTVTIGGGIGGYTYSWSDASNNSLESQDAATTTTVYSLCEGYYTLHIEDENPLGCAVDTTIQIEHRPLSCDTIQLVATTCYGGDNGVLEVSGVGGYYEAYKYEWTSENWPADSVATTASISGLKAGLYTVVISQSNGRVSDTTTIEVGQPSTRLHIPNANIIPEGSFCYNAIGTITIVEPANLAEEFGGNVPFKYYFSHSDWTDSVVVNSGAKPVKVTGLATDDYNLLVVDDLGCQYDTVITVPDLSEFTITRTDSTAPRCFGYEDGKLSIEATSKSSTNFTYQWSNGETTASIGGLAAGTYSVVVTDDSLCVKTDTFELGQPMPIVFSVSSTIPNSCYNLSDGTIEISGLEGGAGLFNRFEFFGDEYYEQTPSVDTSVISFSSLLPTGNYKVRVTDVKSCVSDSVPFRVYSEHPEIMVLKVDLSLPLCDTYTDAGELSLDGSLNVTAFYSVSSTITGVDTIENKDLRYRIDGGKVQSSGQFSGLASGRHTITIGYGDTLSCSTTVSRKLGSRNGFAIDDIYFANTQSDEIFTCPDNELKAYAHTTSAYKSMKWYTPYVEEEEEEETVVEPDTTSADTTRIDTALAISKMRHYFLRANGDSTEVDSVIIDSLPTESVPVTEEPAKPRYVIDADGNVVLGIDSVGSEPDFILPFTFLPYGGDTYYYVKATNGVCMAIDSLHAVAMKPDNKLKTHIEMDGFDSEALKNNGVYEVAEGAELYLVANTLTFDMLYSYEYENNFQWATNTDNAFWMSSHDTMPAVVRPFAENLTFKVSDSVMFYLEDTTFACRYTESVDVRTVSGIKPADVFTPNGDAYNETWGIDGLSSYEHVNIYVFNRWGGRVWQFSGSGLEYVANQWNGRNAKNKPLPSGTYYYVIQCSSDKLGGKKKTGPVTIVR